MPSAEYNANDAESETTKVTPFFANTAQQPRSAITPCRDQNSYSSPDYRQSQRNLADKFITQMQDLNDFLRENMKTAQAFYEIHSNRHRSPPPAYQVGDNVFVNAKNIRTKRKSKKLDWKNLGPFTVIEVIGSHSYKLNLPEDLKLVHPVFHTSLLQPDANNPIQGQINTAPPPIEVDNTGHDLYEIDAILGSRRRRYHGFEYRIKYTGQYETSWQPLSDVVYGNASKLVENYHKKNPKRQRPTLKELSEARSTT